jgi:PhnB protein
MIQPYLRFNGNCEEAFNFYAECFGGKVAFLSRLNNDPNNPVMHAFVQLTESGGAVSGADTDEPITISGIDILAHLPSREKCEKVADMLSVGGEILAGFKPHPPPDDSRGGMGVRDKYGYTWILVT